MSATQRPKWEVLGGNGLWYVGTPGHERIRSTSLSSANRVATAVNEHDALVAKVAAYEDVLTEVRLAQAAECPGPHGDHQFRLRVNAILDAKAGE